jgi:hypothetical protein
MALTCGGSVAPLVGQLSNHSLMIMIDELLAGDDSVIPVHVKVTLCGCGCDQPVGADRMYVNQDHYDRARGGPAITADQIAARILEGASQRLLARECGIGLTALRRLIRSRVR